MLVRQPYDGEIIEEVSVDNANSVEQKLANAVQCFAHRGDWLPPFKRIEILKRLVRLVERDQNQLSLLIAREGGKPLADARIEVTRAINGIECAASELEHLVGSEIPMGLTPASTQRWAFTTKEPIGPVVAISAFNHPLNLIVHQVVPAIAVGCPVIIKPAAATPLSCLRFVDLVYEAMLPPPWCQAVVLEDNALAEGMATDARVAFLSFIGSAKVGWHLRTKLAAGTRCALEHGGSAPVIVDRSAVLERIIEPLVKGGYYHAGQVCVSVQRIFVHDQIKADFVDRLVSRVSCLKVGDPTRLETEVGPLIAPNEVNRVDRWVLQAIQDGGELATGAKRLGDRTYQPTVLIEPPSTSQVSKDEIFGPVICVYGFGDLDDAIAQANSLPTAFQASIFSDDIHAALTAATRLDASAVMVNDHTAFRTDWMPFAGRRQSGLGTGGIPYTMRDMTQDKLILFKTGAAQEGAHETIKVGN
jgi:acyl-CoA reductase-like NAD-dependent aldehyde dehydrogenase